MMIIRMRRPDPANLVRVLQLVAFGLCLLSGAAPAAGKDDRWIEITGKQPFVMLADKKQVVLPLIVAITPDVKPEQIALKLLSVRYEDLVSEEITGAFAITPQIVESAGRGPVIQLTARLQPGFFPGIYELMIEARHVDPAKRPPVKLTVTIRKPAVSFVTPAKLTIEQVFPFLIGSARYHPGQLHISQAPESRFAMTENIAFHPLGYKTSNGLPSPGKIDFTLTKKTISPGEPLVADLTPHDFPIGTATGTVEIRSQDLKAPVKLEVEVRSRRNSVWILALIIPGLIAGWLMRSYLQGRIELAQTKLDGLKVMAQLEQALNQRQDQQFKAAVQGHMDTLKTALDGRDRDHIVTQAEAAAEGLKTAIDEFKTAFDTAEQSLNALWEIVDRDYALPPSLASILKDAASTITSGRRELEDRLDAGAAQKIADEIKGRLPGRLENAIATWKNDMGFMFEQLQGLRFGLEPERAAQFDEKITALREREGNVTLTIDPGAEQSALNTIHGIQLNLGFLLRWSATQVAQGAEAFSLLLTTRGLANEAGTNALGEQADALMNQLLKAGNRPDPAQPLYEESVRTELIGSFRQLLRETLASAENVEDTEYREIQRLEDENHYFEAAKIIPPKRQILRDEKVANLRGPRLEWLVQAPGQAQEKVKLIPPVEPPVSISVLRSQTLFELAMAKFWQTVIAGAGITILGYILYADKFIGTPAEMAAIFSWGFGLDVTVDKLVEISGKIPGVKK